MFIGSDNISAVDAIYDGLKITLGTMANMTDGLPWPIKAVPQTVLFVLKLFEVCSVVLSAPIFADQR